ncbi:MAG: hypothetical protein DBX55_07120 [Verrucomicrobia bacterium]|nr:MAG: hypothetical protein DBX55_07120 [Verrucomicrobiota bacterium]
MKKRESMTREEVTFHTSFPDLADCEIFVPQQQTGAEYNDISRETTTTPAQWKAKVAAGEWFIYAEPKCLLRCRQRRLRAARQENPMQINPSAFLNLT